MFTDPIVVKFGDYEMDIAPIFKALATFVQKILEFYLPEELKDVAEELK